MQKLNKRPKLGELKQGDIIGIRGAIDHSGRIVAHEHRYLESETDCHTPEELACGTTFCWSILDQDFENHRRPQPRHFTEEELMRITDWLTVRGYLYEDTQCRESEACDQYHEYWDHMISEGYWDDFNHCWTDRGMKEIANGGCYYDE